LTISAHTCTLPRVPELYAEFGTILRAARRDASLSQADLGRTIGLSRASVANIEAGRQHVALDQLFDLAHALGCEPCELLPRLDDAPAGDHVPGLATEVARQGLNPDLTSVFVELLDRALEVSHGSSRR
jgi:transcriptional regulator with XRE-family HTH domain